MAMITEPATPSTENDKFPGKTQIYVTNIAANTTREQLSTHFEQYEGELERYKSSRMGFKSPFGFVWVPHAKVEEVLIAEHKVNEQQLVLQRAKPTEDTIKYFLECRTTRGSFADLTEEQVKEYFTQYGEVTRLKIDQNKGVGFLDMNKAGANKEVTELAWKQHEIAGNVINVKESTSTGGRGRKRRWRGRGRRRWKKKQKKEE